MDTEIVRLFSRVFIPVQARFWVSTDFAEKLAAARGRLLKPRVGKYGQLQEWAEDYEDFEPGHRHISPSFAFIRTIRINAAPKHLNFALVGAHHAGAAAGEWRWQHPAEALPGL